MPAGIGRGTGDENGPGKAGATGDGNGPGKAGAKEEAKNRINQHQVEYQE